MEIKGILVKTNGIVEVIEFEHSLENLQELVGGYIDFVDLGFDEDVNIVLNDEGKLLGLDINQFLVRDGKIIDVLVGDLLIVGVDNESGETISLPEDKIAKYMKLFENGIIEI